MGGVKKYFRRQFQVNMFNWEHVNASDFYLSCLQKNRSIVPLLIMRCVLFMGCLAILLASLILSTNYMKFGYWFIFMTHWGLILITAVSCLASAISVVAYLKGPIEATFGLPWYVKAYWVMFNTAIPMAFFITAFYWLMLTGGVEELDINYAVDPVLDVFIHAVNSLLMLILVLISRHPVRLLHFYCSLGLGIIYLIFSVIYFFAGGVSPFGGTWIYPQLDWAEPGTAVLTTVGAAVALIVMHCLNVAIALGRDALRNKYNKTTTLSISGDYN